MLTCRELVEQADGLLARELGWRERLRVRLHLLVCVNCRRYVRQLGLMLAALSKYRPDNAEQSTQSVLQKLKNP
jgi:Putative zinc-finger